jgi:hypothetical protein
MQVDVWTYRGELLDAGDVIGFDVEAVDGSIGKVDEATLDVGAGYLIVDTGHWILGKKVMLPAGVIEQVDASQEKLHVNRTKDEIKSAPEYDASLARDDGFRNDLGIYYGRNEPAR